MSSVSTLETLNGEEPPAHEGKHENPQKSHQDRKIQFMGNQSHQDTHATRRDPTQQFSAKKRSEEEFLCIPC